MFENHKILKLLMIAATDAPYVEVCFVPSVLFASV